MSLNLYRYKAQLLRVVDGDTIDAMIDLGFETYVKRRIRMTGINAPESRGATREIGKAASAHLQQLLEIEGTLFCISHEIEKFGRVLGTLILVPVDGPEIDLNQRMITDGHAIPYDGGKRSDEDFLGPAAAA